MIILKKLDNIEVLYSLIDVNKRFDTILHDPIFTSRLQLMCFWEDIIYPLPDEVINRFCLEILPKIGHEIKWLNVESSSMASILLSTMYSSLNGLSLYNLESETARFLFTGKIFSSWFQ